MPSSISSSETNKSPLESDLAQSALRRLPSLRGQVLLGALMMLVAFIVVMEARLKTRGIRPTAVDNEAAWIDERARASSLGAGAVILVGSSRMQTGIDLDVLRERTKLEPVQLAIDGSSFIPVLAGLAKDAKIRGTVIVAFQDSALTSPEGKQDVADRYETAYEEQSGTSRRFDYFFVENLLSDAIRHHLRSYADGARPLSSLLTRVVPARATPQYAIVLADRSRLADYSTVDLPTIYYTRAIRELGQSLEFPAGTKYDAIEAQIRARIAGLQQSSEDLFMRRAATVSADAAAIESRGGAVFFVVMPTSGLVTEMEDKQFPRNAFWARFAELTHSRTLHFKDIPALQGLPVPDGSHIDYHDRAALTNILLDALGYDTDAHPGPASPRSLHPGRIP